MLSFPLSTIPLALALILPKSECQIPNGQPNRHRYRDGTPENPLAYTLSSAAKATGRGKATISKAISSGRLSAVKQEDGSYIIDPAELHRVYPPARSPELTSEHKEPSGTPMTNPEFSTQIRDLQADLQRAREQIEELKADRTDARAERDEWRAQAKALALIADQRPRDPAPSAVIEPKARSWWPWGRG